MYRCLIVLALCISAAYAENIDHVTAQAWEYALPRLEKMANDLSSANELPRTITESGTMHTVGPRDWTSGFFPGCLWYAYEYSGRETLKIAAKKFTTALESQKNNNNTHDIGFMVFCSFGNGYRLLNDANYRDICLDAAATLSTRYNSTTECIKSWDWGNWDYPVIIDNMMNLELLLWAAKERDDKRLENMAVSHAEKTMQNHLRNDASTYHVVDYNSSTGNVISRETFQGYADESVWARGQAWGIYGFTMMYRFTGKIAFLQTATALANFFLTNLPSDTDVPYWDFNDPLIPDAPKDASAAAIAASALFELAHLDSTNIGRRDYRQDAQTILKELCSEKFRASEVSDYFLLTHSVGNMPDSSEIDVPLNYGDYYFLEALLRYKKYAPIRIKHHQDNRLNNLRILQENTISSTGNAYTLDGRAVQLSNRIQASNLLIIKMPCQKVRNFIAQ